MVPLLATFSAAGCLAAPARSFLLSGSGARLSGGDAAKRDCIAAILPRVEARVVEVVGNSWPWAFEVELVDHVSLDLVAAVEYPARTVLLGPKAVKVGAPVDFYLAHELTHVHAPASWEAFPPVVQEGLANWVATIVTGRAPPTEPPTDVLLRVFELSLTEYWSLPELELQQVDEAARWLASKLLPQ